MLSFTIKVQVTHFLIVLKIFFNEDVPRYTTFLNQNLFSEIHYKSLPTYFLTLTKTLYLRGFWAKCLVRFECVL